MKRKGPGCAGAICALEHADFVGLPRRPEVTFRKGRPFAAYVYLPRGRDARVARTLDEGHGVHVDLDGSGVPMGIEVTAPGVVTVLELNAI